MLGLADLFEPIKGSIVDSLSYVEAKVKASMIGASKYQHELILFVLYLRNPQLRVFAFQIVRIDECSLMPEKLLTGDKMLREKPDSFLLYNFFVLVIDGVPKL